jgi:hypothetical protein
MELSDTQTSNFKASMFASDRIFIATASLLGIAIVALIGVEIYNSSNAPAPKVQSATSSTHVVNHYRPSDQLRPVESQPAFQFDEKKNLEKKMIKPKQMHKAQPETITQAQNDAILAQEAMIQESGVQSNTKPKSEVQKKIDEIQKRQNRLRGRNKRNCNLQLEFNKDPCVRDLLNNQGPNNVISEKAVTKNLKLRNDTTYYVNVAAKYNKQNEVVGLQDNKCTTRMMHINVTDLLRVDYDQVQSIYSYVGQNVTGREKQAIERIYPLVKHQLNAAQVHVLDDFKKQIDDNAKGFLLHNSSTAKHLTKYAVEFRGTAADKSALESGTLSVDRTLQLFSEINGSNEWAQAVQLASSNPFLGIKATGFTVTNEKLAALFE